jgi:hypothetical protein
MALHDTTLDRRPVIHTARLAIQNRGMALLRRSKRSRHAARIKANAAAKEMVP